MTDETRTKREQLAERFPAEDHSKVRKGGSDRTYVDAEKIIRRANDVLGWDWDFRVIREGMTDTEAWVLGEVSAEIDGRVVMRQQYGCENITRGERDKPITDLFKIAATDSIKKCLTLFGVALYLYNEDERHEVEQEMREASRPKPADKPEPTQLRQPTGPRLCVAKTGDAPPDDACNAPITDPAILKASLDEFKKPLCETHMQRAREFVAERQRAIDFAAAAEAQKAQKAAPVTPESTEQADVTPTPIKPTAATTGRPCSARRKLGEKRVPCDVILYPGTAESYNGRDVKSELVIEKSLAEFERVLCGSHLFQAREHKRRTEESDAAAQSA